jgi:hypothetical protein
MRQWAVKGQKSTRSRSPKKQRSSNGPFVSRMEPVALHQEWVRHSSTLPFHVTLVRSLAVGH